MVAEGFNPLKSKGSACQHQIAGIAGIFSTIFLLTDKQVQRFRESLGDSVISLQQYQQSGKTRERPSDNRIAQLK